MGNIDELREPNTGPSTEDLPETTDSTDFDGPESPSSRILETGDLLNQPIKLPIGSEIALEKQFHTDTAAQFDVSKNLKQEGTSYQKDISGSPQVVLASSEDESFPLSDSLLPDCLDILAESSPIFSDSSDVFHTPEMSFLSSEEDTSGHMISHISMNEQVHEDSKNSLEPSGSFSAKSGVDVTISRKLPAIADDSSFKIRQTEVNCNLSTDPLKVGHAQSSDATDHAPDFSGLPGQSEPNGLMSEIEVSSPSLAAILVSSGETNPIAIDSDKLSESLLLQENEIVDKKPLDPLDLCLTECVQEGINTEHPRLALPSPPRHTADRPNWALAPNNPSESKSTMEKKPLHNQRRRGLRRGKPIKGEGGVDGLLSASSSANDSIESLTPTGIHVWLQSANQFHCPATASAGQEMKLPVDPLSLHGESGHHVFGPSSKSSPCSEMSEPDPISKPEIQDDVSDAIMTSMAPSAVIYSTSLAGNVPRSRNASTQTDKLDKRPSHRSPSWRSALILPTIAESNSDLRTDEFSKDMPLIIYQSSPRPHFQRSDSTEDMYKESATVTEACSEQKALGTPAAPTLALLTPPEENSDFKENLSPSMTPLMRNRLSWPSLSDELKFHANARPPLLWHGAMNEFPSMTPLAPSILQPLSLDHANNSKPASESANVESLSRNLHPGQETFSLYESHTSSRDGCAQAQYSLPPRPLQIRANPQHIKLPSGTTTTRPAFQSSIPVLTRSHSHRVFNSEEDNKIILSTHLSEAHAPDNFPNVSFPPMLQRPLLPKPSLPGHKHRVQSQSFTSREETRMTAPSPDGRSRPASRAIPSISGNPKTAYHPLPGLCPPTQASMPSSSRNQAQFPFPDMVHVANHQANQTYHQRRERRMSASGQLDPILFGAQFQEDNPFMNNVDGWNGRHGLGFASERSVTPHQIRQQNANTSQVPVPPQQPHRNALYRSRDTSSDGLRTGFRG